MNYNIGGADDPKLYHQLLPRVIASFYLPELPEIGNHEATNQEAYDMLRDVPFPCIRIVPSDIHKNEPYPGLPTIRTLKNEIICEVIPGALSNGGTSFLWAGRQRVVANGKTVSEKFRPENGRLPVESAALMPHSFYAFIQMLRDRKNRYIERPITRQVRRAEGIRSPDYREYTIIAKHDAPKDVEVLRLSDVARRHPYLHAVRAHLRRLRNDRIIPVRAHTRGKGTLFHVREYKVE